MCRVLVVEDDPQIRQFVAAALHEGGHEVLTAADGEALDLARRAAPDLILLDLLLPGLSGEEIARRLRADPATATVPLVAMSAQDRLRAGGDALPVDDRLPKPFDLAQLDAVIARWTSDAPGGTPGSPPPTSDPAPRGEPA